MNPAWHQQANAIFLGACELAPNDIPAFVQTQCGDDAELAQHVFALLSADARTDGFLESPLLGLDAAAPESIAGERGYRLLRRLGAGGMGEVHLAERSDGEFRHKVAIKLMHGDHRLRRDGLLRFRAERQILASLNHPNIARLLDGGTLPSGAPFLVMEYVEGEPIDVWCRKQSLDARARVGLVLKVCDAVATAHQALIVHRDLKPSNILVNSEGEPKLLDFGIAKVLNADAFAHSMAQTHTGRAPMTLAYASPEQVRGENVGTASDVYSLGVVLYELLTGSLPYRAAPSDPVSMARAVCEQAPDAPSRHGATAPTAPHLRLDAEQRRLRSQLRGDLDAIVLKALRKEPGERYRSVELFAADLSRFLEGMPVHARRGSRWYAARKFVARHRFGVVAALLAVLGTLAFVSILQVQLNRASVERDKARAMTDFLVRMFDVSDPESPRAQDSTSNAQITVREVIDAYAPRIETALANQPEARASMLAVIARVYFGLDQFEASWRYGVAALRALEETGQVPSDASVDARLFLLFPLYVRGDMAELMRQANLAVDEARSLQPQGSFNLARALNSRASIFRTLKDLGKAARDAEPALSMMRAHQPADSPYIAVALKEIAQIANLRGDFAACDRALREAREGWPARLGKLHVYYTALQSLHAVCLGKLGRSVEAEAELRDARTRFIKVRGADSLSAARASLQLARLLIQEQRSVEAIPLLRSALEVYRHEFGENHAEFEAVRKELAEQTLASGGD